MLREAGLHRFMIVPVDEINLVGRDGNAMKIPAEVLEKLDRIAGEGRQEEDAHRTRWAPQARPQHRANDPRTAERKRRQRQKEREAETVTPSRPVTPVTQRDTVTTVPRLPAELDLLQNGGTKTPALTR
jgi:hypothetical protein